MKFFLLLFVIMSCGENGGKNSSGSRSHNSVTGLNGNKIQLLDLVNSHRANLGLQKLTLAPALTNEIQNHTNNMANHSVPFGHLGMNTRCTKAESNMGGGNLCGEIVAQSSEGATAHDVFNQWMNSSGHRGKIEEPRFNRVGTGMSLDMDNDLYSGMLFLEY